MPMGRMEDTSGRGTGEALGETLAWPGRQQANQTVTLSVCPQVLADPPLLPDLGLSWFLAGDPIPEPLGHSLHPPRQGTLHSKAGPSVWMALGLLILLVPPKMSPPQGGVP